MPGGRLEQASPDASPADQAVGHGALPSRANDWLLTPSWGWCSIPRNVRQGTQAHVGALGAHEPATAGVWTSSVFQYKGADAWYEAAVKVAKAHRSLRKPYYPAFSVVIPAVILDGNMLAADVSNGSLQLMPCDRAQIPFEYASKKYRAGVTPLHLLTVRAVPEFLRRLKALEEEAMSLIDSIYPMTDEGKSDESWRASRFPQDESDEPLDE